MIKPKFYTKKFSLKTGATVTNKKLKSCFTVIMTLLISFISLNGVAQMISNVGISTAAVCPGSIVSISFTVTNGIGVSNYFTSSTHYTIFASNSSGTGFAPLFTSTSPTVPSGDGGSAIITFSNLTTPDAPFGSGYKISISADFPNISVNSGSNVSGPITVGPNPTATFNKIFASSCHGGTDGSISVTASGGTSPYTYSWTGVGGFTANTAAIDNLSLGDYNVVVEDQNLCSTSLTGITIKQAPAVSVGYQMTNPGCNGNDGTISAFRIGGVYDGVTSIQYKLDGAAAAVPYQSSGAFTGLSAGNYTVTVKDSKGCTGSTAITLTQAATLVFTPNGYNINVSSCGDGSDGAIVTTVSGGVAPYTYTYTLNGVVQHGISSLQTFGFGGLLPNVQYNINVTDSKGCSISKSVTLSQASTPTAIIAYRGDVTCIGGNDGFMTIGYFAGGVPGYMYSSNGGRTYQDSYRFLNLVAGTYNVVVKDSKGCTSAPVPVTIADGTVACTQGRVGGNTSSNNANRVGSAMEEISPLSKTALNASLSIQAYPNPSAPSSDFTLDVHGNNTDQVLIFVTDILGRRCYQAQGNANQQYKLGSNLRPGIYFVQVLQGDSVQTIKIVKE